ncbi:DNA fragmentation factor subunit alpha isoform X2 [Crotalus tigris]|uniref:DNA fragmentation factor subunit alpha isoform X2 n=1 Tax=Crotalus tigris TaxID=88082 RepID=UPI00192F3FAD|nr:DNA fragmentation factor subunit alpha isoform X2 [Crotalus tigris]
MAEGASGLPRLKQCLIRRTGQQEQHGVAASTLQELKIKACNLLAIDLASQPVTLVLAGDGTIVDDDDYFLGLPPNTKFGVVAKNEIWAAGSNTGEGTTWLEEEVTNASEVDGGGEKWQVLARQLKNDLSTIVLMSEEDLQVTRDPSGDPGQAGRGASIPSASGTLPAGDEKGGSGCIHSRSIRSRGKIRGKKRYCGHGEQRNNFSPKESVEHPRCDCAERKACPRTQPGQSRFRAGLQRRFRNSFSGPKLGQAQDRSFKEGMCPGVLKTTAAISLSKFTQDHL